VLAFTLNLKLWSILFLYKFSVQKISEFREKKAEKRREQETRDKQRLEQLQTFLQEQAAYDLQRYCYCDLNVMTCEIRKKCVYSISYFKLFFHPA